MKSELIFEPSWEKAIAPQDREAIEQLHKESPIQHGKLICIPIRAALNHQGSLLAMVLIQNGTNTTFEVKHTELEYCENEREAIAASVFSLPQVKVPPYTSMPWTFVFPKESIQLRPLLKKWDLKLSNNSNY